MRYETVTVRRPAGIDVGRVVTAGGCLPEQIRWHGRTLGGGASENASENTEITAGLLEGLVARGLRADRRDGNFNNGGREMVA